MEISDDDIIKAVKNMYDKTGCSPEHMLGYSLTYLGESNLDKLVTSDISMAFKICRGDELAELLEHISTVTGRSVDFIPERHLGCYIRWSCRAIVGAAGMYRPIVLHTPVLLDKRSAYLLFNPKLLAEGSMQYCSPRYSMPMFDFNRGFISKIIARNDPQETGAGAAFSCGLDRLYDSIVVKKVPDAELATIRARTSLLKHELFLDYRLENIADNEHDALRERNAASRAALLRAARNNLPLITPYFTAQSVKPWLNIKEMEEQFPIGHAFKNVYVHQKKYDAKIYTALRQVRVTACYSPFIAAVYADAYIHKHMEAVLEPYSKLNFPDFRIPVKCCCADCMTIERKRGPQPKVDKLYYLEEYLNDGVSEKNDA